MLIAIKQPGSRFRNLGLQGPKDSAYSRSHHDLPGVRMVHLHGVRGRVGARVAHARQPQACEGMPEHRIERLPALRILRGMGEWAEGLAAGRGGAIGVGAAGERASRSGVALEHLRVLPNYLRAKRDRYLRVSGTAPGTSPAASTRRRNAA